MAERNFDKPLEFGAFFANNSKKSPKHPDYNGEIAIDLKNLTAVRQKDGLHIFRLSGWKKQDRTGKTYLSLAVDRFERREDVPAKPARPPQNDDDDLPF